MFPSDRYQEKTKKPVEFWRLFVYDRGSKNCAGWEEIRCYAAPSPNAQAAPEVVGIPAAFSQCMDKECFYG